MTIAPRSEVPRRPKASDDAPSTSRVSGAAIATAITTPSAHGRAASRPQRCTTPVIAAPISAPDAITTSQ